MPSAPAHTTPEALMDHTVLPASGVGIHHADRHPLHPLPIDPADVVAGDPRASWTVLYEDDVVERGLWQMTPGSAAGIEADEMFAVLSGRATITPAEGPSLTVGPGDVGIMRAGTRAVWTVHETLRKAYQITKSPCPA
ncbi:cupin domain-containing protein [Streptomyces sp. G5(2025)]|uniref:cupin domain-containing protein n=1 Tax=Streptomyces sp. G5(2025) TaxID=3406628 RepID=UPI003C230928